MGLSLRDYKYEYAASKYSGETVVGGVSGGVGPASSTGIEGYRAPYLSSHDICHHPDLHSHPHLSDLRQHPRHPAGDFRPPELSSAFGLVNLDDFNVPAGLASDGVPFFSTAAQGRTELMPLHEVCSSIHPRGPHSHSAASSSLSSGHTFPRRL
ncbi:hypothetical protein B0H19DRAFT_83338 [Mycena capillaripes]|nr:hypothetical protein B0H19DRAFT_83338 [Mycena capillaripes]